MKFDLKRPCANCPHRTDCLKGWLGRVRATEIAGYAQDSVSGGKTFPCHKATDQQCAGSSILQEKLERPNQMLRIAERLGLYDFNAMDLQSPVFDSFEDFINHHT